jgi:hypothetical protein
MAKKSNLLENEFIKNSIYGSAERVAQIHKKYNNLLSSIKTPDSEITKSIISELQALHQVLLKQESKFYKALGVSTPAEATNKLEKEIKKWNENGAERLLKQETVKEVF